MTSRSSRLWPFLFLALLLACTNDDPQIDYEGFDCISNNPEFDPEPIPATTGVHTLSFTPNKTLSVTGDDLAAAVTPVNGRNRVFHFRFTLDDTTDPELRELWFEIEPGIDSFTVSDTSLKDINTYFTQSCSCPEIVVGTYPMESGCIQGERLDANHWQVDINLQTLRGNETVVLMASGVFVKVD